MITTSDSTNSGPPHSCELPGLRLDKNGLDDIHTHTHQRTWLSKARRVVVAAQGMSTFTPKAVNQTVPNSLSVVSWTLRRLIRLPLQPWSRARNSDGNRASITRSLSSWSLNHAAVRSLFAVHHGNLEPHLTYQPCDEKKKLDGRRTHGTFQYHAARGAGSPCPGDGAGPYGSNGRAAASTKLSMASSLSASGTEVVKHRLGARCVLQRRTSHCTTE